MDSSGISKFRTDLTSDGTALTNFRSYMYPERFLLACTRTRIPLAAMDFVEAKKIVWPLGAILKSDTETSLYRRLTEKEEGDLVQSYADADIPVSDPTVSAMQASNMLRRPCCAKKWEK